MDIEKLIQTATLLAMLAASMDQLPRMIHTVRMAQVHLLRDSQASKWGQDLLLPASPPSMCQ